MSCVRLSIYPFFCKNKRNNCKGKCTMRSYATYLKNFNKYKYLLALLVKQDFKRKYKGSVLGVLWSLLNPLLKMVVLTIIFSTLFEQSVENFPVYLLSGLLLFEFFSSSTSIAMQSIISSAHLINKVYMPKYIIPLSRILSGFIFFLISLIILMIMMIVTNANITINIIYAPIFLLLFLLFTCGIGLLLSALTVFFRDIEHLYGVLLTILMYASAIFYPPDIIPEKYRFVLTLNPLHYFIEGFRDAVFYGTNMDLSYLFVSTVLAAGSMIMGVWVFVKTQDKFILYL